jgi:hypothetical protein
LKLIPLRETIVKKRDELPSLNQLIAMILFRKWALPVLSVKGGAKR